MATTTVKKHQDAGAAFDEAVGPLPKPPEGSAERVTIGEAISKAIRHGRNATDMLRDYRCALTVEKVSLTTKKMKDTEGSGYEVPQLQVVLSITDETAAEIGAAFCAFQGREVTVDVSGEARQLSLF